MRFLPWEFRLPSSGKASCDNHAIQPRVHAGCFNPPNSDMDYEIYNSCTDVNACDCAQWSTDTVRVCTDD